MKFKTALQRRCLLKAGAGSIALWPLSSVRAQQPKLRSVGEFFRPPQLENVSMSQDGKSLLALRQSNGRRNLAVVELSSLKVTIITNFSDADVSDARWINNERILFSLRDLRQGDGYQRAGGLMAINKDGTGYVQLAQRDFLTDGDSRAKLPASTAFLRKGRTTAPDEVIVTVYSSGGDRRLNQRLEVLNTKSGRTRLVMTGTPGDVSEWHLDSKDVVRALITRDERTFQLWTRDADGQEWRSLKKWDITETGMTFLGNTPDDSKLVVLAYANGSDTRGVYLLDTKTGAIDPEPMVSLKGYDIDGGVGEPERELLGVRYEASRPATAWFSEEHEALQLGFEKIFPDRTVRFTNNLKNEGQKLLVFTSGATDAGTYYVYDQKAKSLTKVGETRPWLPAAEMADSQFIRYTARDGLSIPAMLTLPKGAKAEKLPLIVLHYGGPWVRPIAWRFDPLVQFLASRGYAVLMPAPRASTGFGLAFHRAGYKQWGLAMQDDITDGALHLVKQGIADGDRLCIAGASYGGYAAMMGLVKEPDLWRCGINWVGVTDPALIDVSWGDTSGSPYARYAMPEMLGTADKDPELFAKISPLRRAAEIKAPVLMGYGGSDVRVPLVHGERMRDALKANNREVEFVIYAGEGHNWILPESRIDFWTRAEAFLAKHMAPRGK